MNGKGSRPRSNFSKRFRDNYSKINWGRKNSNDDPSEWKCICTTETVFKKWLPKHDEPK